MSELKIFGPEVGFCPSKATLARDDGLLEEWSPRVINMIL